jgi:hypothetical protein
VGWAGLLKCQSGGGAERHKGLSNKTHFVIVYLNAPMGLNAVLPQKDMIMIISATNHINGNGEVVEFFSTERFAELLNGKHVSMLAGREADIRDEEKDYFLLDARAVSDLDDAIVVKHATFVAQRLPVSGWFVKSH